MSKKRDLRSYKILAIVILIATAMLACGIGGQATQAPGAQPPEEPQAQVPPEGAAAPIEQDASSQAAGSGILFQDDFQDGQPDNWQITSSWYVQQAGDIYNFSAAGRGGAWVPAGYNWSDYAFDTDVVLNDGSLILSFDYTDSGRYLLHLREDGLFLVKEQPPLNYTVLAHTGPVPVGQWHRIGVKGKDGRLQVRVDDQLWIDTIDAQPLSKGTISVSTLSGSQAAVDNVLVSLLSGPLEAAPVVAPPPIADPQVVEDELEEISSVIPVENIEPIQEPVLAPPQAPPEAQEVAPPEEVPSDEDQAPPQVVPVDQGQLESDLSIVDVDLPSQINQGTPFSVSVTIHNAGPDAAVPYTVLWYPDGPSFIGCSWDIYDHQTGTDNRRTVTCEYPGYPTMPVHSPGLSWQILRMPLMILIREGMRRPVRSPCVQNKKFRLSFFMPGAVAVQFWHRWSTTAWKFWPSFKAFHGLYGCNIAQQTLCRHGLEQLLSMRSLYAASVLCMPHPFFACRMRT